MKAILEVKQIVIPVIIGVEPEEKHKHQKIFFDIIISFNDLPTACSSDNIEDTVCYAKLADSLNEFCAKREFQVIEHLAHSAFLLIKENFIKDRGKLSLSVTKHPPHPLIQSSCSFTVEG